MRFVYGGLTLFAAPSQTLRLHIDFLTRRQTDRPDHYDPQPHTNNGCHLTLAWFGLYPVRSPLLGVSRLISFPAGT